MNHESQETALEKTLKIVETVETVRAAVNAVREKKRTSACCKKVTNQKEKEKLQ